MLESIRKIAKKILGEEGAEELEVSVAVSDGCKGEESYAKIIEKIKGDEPC